MAEAKLSESIELKQCNLCQHQIASNAHECPGCGLRIVSNIIKADNARNNDLAQRIAFWLIGSNIALAAAAWIGYKLMNP